MSHRTAPMQGLRRSLRDIRTHDWSAALRVFDAALLSGAAVDAGTFGDCCTACRCGQCQGRRRCTGVAMMCATEAPVVGSASGQSASHSTAYFIAQLAQSSTLMRPSSSAFANTHLGAGVVGKVSGDSECGGRILDAWRLLESSGTGTHSGHHRATSVAAVISDTVMHVQLLINRGAFDEAERWITTMAAYAPCSVRRALWRNVWCLACSDTRHQQHPTTTRVGGVGGDAHADDGDDWLPDRPSQTASEALTRLCERAAGERVLIPSDDIFAQPFGLTTIAEHSRSAEILLPASLIARMVTVAASPSNGMSSTQVRSTREILRVFFPRGGVAPPRKLSVLPLVDELRIVVAAGRSAAAPHSPSSRHSDDGGGDGGRGDRVAALAQSIVLAWRSEMMFLQPLSVGVISRSRSCAEACAAAGVVVVK